VNVDQQRSLWGELVDASVDAPDIARKMLLDHPGLMESKGLHGETPLHFLAIEGFAEGVRFLLACGANPDPVNRFGNTPLQECVFLSLDRTDVVSALLQAGADPYRCSETLSCAWHMARRSDLPTMRLLFKDVPAPGDSHDRCALDDLIFGGDPAPTGE
jgi:ankyrin repeat protein